MSDIFISYASEDRPRAETLAKVLTRHGWAVWWDRRIPVGKTFAQVIEEEIRATKCVIVLWSKAAIKSDWVHNEAAEGKQRGILAPVFIEDVPIPFEFRRIQAARLVDWTEESNSSEFSELLKDIERIIGHRGSPFEEQTVATSISFNSENLQSTVPSFTSEVVEGPYFGHQTSDDRRGIYVSVRVRILIVNNSDTSCSLLKMRIHSEGEWDWKMERLLAIAGDAPKEIWLPYTIPAHSASQFELVAVLRAVVFSSDIYFNKLKLEIQDQRNKTYSHWLTSERTSTNRDNIS
jgi:hypothetical protein